MQRLRLFTFISFTFITLSGLATAGCGGDDDDAPAPAKEAHLEITGTWESTAFGMTETAVIDDASWSSDYGDGPSAKDILEFSNTERFAIVSGPAWDDADKTVFDRLVWTKPDGDVFYSCTVSFGCATAEETAEGNGNDDDMGTCDAPVADESELETGCGASGFSWTKYTKQ